MMSNPEERESLQAWILSSIAALFLLGMLVALPNAPRELVLAGAVVGVGAAAPEAAGFEAAMAAAPAPTATTLAPAMAARERQVRRQRFRVEVEMFTVMAPIGFDGAGRRGETARRGASWPSQVRGPCSAGKEKV